MKSILEKLGGDVRSRNARADLRLRFTRFRRFLENIRGVIGQIEDAKEKLREEYIFDRHYALSLVDGVVEEASMMAFNASVLAPAAGREIYLQLDALKEFAREEFLKSGGIQMKNFAVPTSPGEVDPETQLLSAVLRWFTGPLPEGSPVVTDFIRFVVDEAFRSCRESERIGEGDAFAGKVELDEINMLKTFDIDGMASPRDRESLSARNIKCRPFGLLFLGSMNPTGGAEVRSAMSGADRRMFFDEDATSLRISGNKIDVQLEATLCGNIDSDFIFLYCRNPVSPVSAITREFQAITTGQGTLAWIFDVPTDYLEKQLIRLGSMLLC